MIYRDQAQTLSSVGSGLTFDWVPHRLGQRLQELKQQRAAGTDRPEGEDAKLPALADLYAVHKKENDDCYATLHSSKPVPAKSETSKNFSAYFYGAKAAEDISLNSQVDEKRVRLLRGTRQQS